MMEEPETTPEQRPEDDQAAPAKGPAKVIRAGGEAKGSQNLQRSGSGDGGNEAAASAPAAAAATAATVPILRAGRSALDGAQAAGRQTVEAAEQARREAAEGAEEALRAAESAGNRAGGQVLREWLTCAQRAYIRNTGALVGLLYCRTPSSLLQWQSNLLNETAADLSATNARVLQLVSHKA
jgi:hypothetical protein